MQVQKSIQHCMMACKSIELQQERQKKMMTELKPHIQSLQSIGGMDVLFAYMKKDFNGMLENYCKMMENQKAKKNIVEMLTAVVNLYNEMRGDMIQLIDCFQESKGAPRCGTCSNEDVL